MVKKTKKRKSSIKQTKRNVAGILDRVLKPKITIIGIGGGGCSIVAQISSRIKGVNFIAANTDLQSLRQISRKIKIFHFGKELTGGLGCGMNPQLGRKAAQNSKEKIIKLLEGTDFTILISSLGGGTGSGATPIFAEISKEINGTCQYLSNSKNIALGIFTLPFEFEGKKRLQIAKTSLKKTAPHLNAVSSISNQRIFKLIDKKTPIKKAFDIINQKIADDLSGLVEGIYLPGLINIDFADFKTILEGKGKLAFLNSVIDKGSNRSEKLTQRALENPLYEYSIKDAERILFNISSDKNLRMQEVERLSRTIFNSNKKAKIIFGVSQKENYKNKIRLTLLAITPAKKEIKRVKQKKKEEKEEKPLEDKKIVVNKVKKQKKPKQAKKKVRKATKKVKPLKKSLKKPVAKKKPVIKKKKPPLKLEKTIRKNALQIKKDIEETEKEILKKEAKWDVPAFLRQKEE